MSDTTPTTSQQVRLLMAAAVLGLLLAAVSFALWWSRRADGSAASSWTGPHFSWLGVLLCLGLVSGRRFLRRGPSPGRVDGGG